jgi:hypothetical protein
VLQDLNITLQALITTGLGKHFTISLFTPEHQAMLQQSLPILRILLNI